MKLVGIHHLVSLFVLFFALACGAPEPVAPGCADQSDCAAGWRCVDGVCSETPEAGVPGPDMGFMMCEDMRDPCGIGSGAICCAPEEVCEGRLCLPDCGSGVRCAGECCAEGQECYEDSCVVECAPESRCGEMGELCCAAEDACLSDACVPLGGPCESTDDCDLEDICDPVLRRCIPRSAVMVCEYRPPVGDFSPGVGCQWRPTSGTYDDVVMTPSVANLTDDNGDGQTDRNDIPDIVFVAFDRERNGCCTGNGRLTIVSGRCNEDGTMNQLAQIASPFVDNSSGVALGNLHPAAMLDERTPEIVVTMRPAGTVAFRRTADDGSSWEELWRNSTYPSGAHTRGGAQPSLADLDGDGAPEVIIGNIVLDGLTGALRWDGRVTVRSSAGIGNNAFLGPASTVADLDLDGAPEVIAGNTVYNGRTGAEVWTYGYVGSGSSCQGTLPCDGFNAVGNFDDDPEGEVVIVRSGEVFVLEHTGELKHRVTIPSLSCSRNESGPPTIADFDGDGRPEIATAGADYYVVVDFDCTGSPLPEACDAENILWKVRNRDCSSRATGSSVFDFEGDGASEVVYADETTFRIFDGRDGTILFEDDSHSSNTRMEMPIVVDVDNDGKSEVVIPEPNTSSSTLGGIEIWEDLSNNWIRTRRIWNQHTYHVTNIDEDGQVPAVEEANWSRSRLNNFRQNVQPGGIFDAPDLVIEGFRLVSCDALGVAEIEVSVGNQGALGVAPGIPVRATANPAGMDPIDLGVERTTMPILPGGTAEVVFTLDVMAAFSFMSFTVNATADDDGMGRGEYNECREDNNTGVSDPFMTCSLD